MYDFEIREQKMFELWDFMVDSEIATENEIGVACHFGGRSLDTLESLLFYKTGYHSLEQMSEED